MLIKRILALFICFFILFLTNFSFVSWYRYDPNNNSVILNPNLWFDQKTEQRINSILYERSPVSAAKQLLKAAKKISDKLKKWNILPKYQKYAQEVADHFVKMSENASHIGKMTMDKWADFVKQAWNKLDMTWDEAYKFVNEVIWKIK